jgi:outer membrane protein OmpA-like peptidoglycan-associated protein
MALHAALPRPALRVWWGAVAVVPLALAGLGMALFPASVTASVASPVAAPRTAVAVPAAPAPAYPTTFAGASPITFAADRAELAGPSAAAVARVAEVLGDGPGPRVTLTGYAADTPGPPEVAQRLSEQRAQVVVDALVAAGVRRERLVVAGRGSADPLATPAQSRRVEIKAE